MLTEPRIQYARAADGATIAYWQIGQGTPLVLMPAPPFSHTQLEWTIPESRRWFERLASAHTLVRYDGRGTGLSSREDEDYSLEANAGDLATVIDHLNLKDVAIFAAGDSTMPAIYYAARNPEIVSRLIIWTGWARRADVSGSSQTRSLRALLEQDWEIYTETVARVLLGWKEDAAARRFAAFYRECTSPEVLRKLVPAVYDWDVTDYLPEVRCPALIVHRRGIRGVDVEVARRLAAGLPDSRLAILEGDSPLPFMGDVNSVYRCVAEFLGDEIDEEDAEDTHQAQDDSAPVTILFTDMEGSTALTQRLGDEGAQRLLRRHNAVVRDALLEYNGSEIKHTGDGIMASFRSARRALDCGVAIQRRLAVDAGDDTAFRVRIGINSGEPVSDERDLFGTSVQLAARVCEAADPGQVLVSNVVRELVAGKGFLFSDRGQITLRGFEDPVRLFELRWQDS